MDFNLTEHKLFLFDYMDKISRKKYSSSVKRKRNTRTVKKNISNKIMNMFVVKVSSPLQVAVISKGFLNAK